MRILPALLLSLLLPGPLGAQISRHVRLVDNLPLAGNADVWVDADFAYVARFGGTSGIRIVDISDPTDLALAATYTNPQAAADWDVKVSKLHAYLGNQGNGVGLIILDVRNPRAPILVRNYSHPNITSVHNVWVDSTADIAYCSSNTTGRVEILDVSTPAAPVYLGSFSSASPGFVHDMVTQGNILYASFLDGGFSIADITDPSNPQLLGFRDYPNAFTHNAWPTADGLTLCTTDEQSGGHMRVWDISDLGAIDQVGSYSATPTGSIHNVYVRGDLAYMAYYKEGLRIVDIRDRTNPVEVGFYDTFPVSDPDLFAGAWGAYIWRDEIYVADTDFGLFALHFEPVVATVAPVSPVVPRGGTLAYDVALQDSTGLSQTVTALATVSLPGGEPYAGNPVAGPVTVALGPNGTLSHRVQHRVPVRAPVGTYTYTVRLEDGDGIRVDEASFTFEVTGGREGEAAAVGGTLGREREGEGWEVTGWFSGPREARAVAPRRPAFVGAFPNPFTARTELRLAVPGEGADQSMPVRLAIYDLRGHLVRRLLSGVLVPGPHGVSWDGGDEAGGRVAPGIYFSRLEAGGKIATQRVVLAR